MAYTNTLTPEQISEMLMSISNSMWQEIKRHKDCPHTVFLEDAYSMACSLDRLVCLYIVRQDKNCIVKLENQNTQ